MAPQVVVSSTAIVIEVLDTDNYEDWSVRVKTYLLANDLWDAIEFEAPREDEPKFEAWRTKNAKALHAIQISCGNDAFSVIKNMDTARKAWHTLAKKFSPAEKYKEPGILFPMYVVDAEERVQISDELAAGQDKSSSSHNVHEHGRWYKDFPRYGNFIEQVASGNWDFAKAYHASDPDAIRATGVLTGKTALHVAVEHGQVELVKELVELMTDDALEIQRSDGRTALGLAIEQGETQMVKYIVEMQRSDGRTALGLAIEQGETQLVKYIVEKNKRFLNHEIGHANMIPLFRAYCMGKWELARYLYSITPIEVLLQDNGRYGAGILCDSFHSNEYDISGHLIRRCPNLAMAVGFYGQSPLCVLSGMSSAFLSGTQLGFPQRWTYDSIHIKPSASTTAHDFRIDLPKLENNGSTQSVPFAKSVIRLFHRLVQNLLSLLGINDIRKMKLIHVRTLEILDCMLEGIKGKGLPELRASDALQASLLVAVKNGLVEFITHMCQANPYSVRILGVNRENIFHHAISCRQERVYCLLFGLDKGMRDYVLRSADNFNNTLLHSAARLSLEAFTRLKKIKGATLQMQRELQWFEEVKSIVPPTFNEIVNRDNLTPRQLFTKDHEELMKEGERSIKETATSSTVVGALIVTIMFAAAFTVPGGNNEDTGYPMFLHKDLFMVFLVFDTISLFSSATSVMIFLGILTSRYAEDDFLKSLPTKMIVGLFALFLSIAAMMIAFVSALLIMLHGKTWIIAPVSVLACVPVASFVWMQFPLLLDLVNSTYGPGIFHKKVKPWLRDM